VVTHHTGPFALICIILLCVIVVVVFGIHMIIALSHVVTIRRKENRGGHTGMSKLLNATAYALSLLLKIQQQQQQQQQQTQALEAINCISVFAVLQTFIDSWVQRCCTANHN
jgi:hypothetical protein